MWLIKTLSSLLKVAVNMTLNGILRGLKKGYIYKNILLLYSWRFSRYSAPIHWLVDGHRTSNNETVSRQMP